MEFYPYIHWGFGAFKPFILLASLRTIYFSDELQPTHGVPQSSPKNKVIFENQGRSKTRYPHNPQLFHPHYEGVFGLKAMTLPSVGIYHPLKTITFMGRSFSVELNTINNYSLIGFEFPSHFLCTHFRWVKFKL